ncbi:hypothetical protein [Methanobacterium petrolearium]|uniref:hypothetical protein n=1 Tax=Methanobacterium petrolearium TaxID=710190 RepID=UPI0030813DD1|nr:hypothetical protein [Methanobacterium petrolearium]
MACVNAAGNLTTPKTNSTSEVIPNPYTDTVTPWYPIPSLETGSILGYYINPSVTPISEIDFTALKNAGITDIYVLVRNSNYTSVLPEAKAKADSVGIRTHAWVFPGFKYASQVRDMKIGVQLDVETYNMSEYIPEIKAMREATQGVTFSVCTKPDVWDGNQYYNQIVPYCDYIVPMLYLGEYPHEIKDLSDWTMMYNIIFPGKIVAGLQTYQSEDDYTPLNQSTMLTETRAVQFNTRGVILFRYGLSNYNDV